MCMVIWKFSQIRDMRMVRIVWPSSPSGPFWTRVTHLIEIKSHHSTISVWRIHSPIIWPWSKIKRIWYRQMDLRSHRLLCSMLWRQQFHICRIGSSKDPTWIITTSLSNMRTSWSTHSPAAEAKMIDQRISAHSQWTFKRPSWSKTFSSPWQASKESISRGSRLPKMAVWICLAVKDQVKYTLSTRSSHTSSNHPVTSHSNS